MRRIETKLCTFKLIYATKHWHNYKNLFQIKHYAISFCFFWLCLLLQIAINRIRFLWFNILQHSSKYWLTILDHFLTISNTKHRYHSVVCHKHYQPNRSIFKLSCDDLYAYFGNAFWFDKIPPAWYCIAFNTSFQHQL